MKVNERIVGQMMNHFNILTEAGDMDIHLESKSGGELGERRSSEVATVKS